MIQQTLTNMSILKFSQTLEEHIQNEIDEAYPLNWDEDYITKRLCVSLKRLEYSQVEVLNTFHKIFIKPFKLKGSNENKFGDLAIIIDLEFKDGDKLKGVAYLEAKRCYAKTNEYTALDFDQLKRIYTNAPNARLLLYNYQPMSTLAPTGLDTKQSAIGILPKMPVTYTAVTNLNTVIKLNEKSDRLHKVSIPFSYQFSFRYLFGKDLEYDEDKIKAAQGYLNENIGLPAYVIMVTIKPGRKGEKTTNLLFNPDINKELYAEITDIHNFRK
jgi:hypothetical protein